MQDYIDPINKILALGTIGLQVVILIISINLIFFRRLENKFLQFFKKFTFIFGFLIALGAVLVSLFYSEIIGYPACTLCWWQRIFLYPQLILFSLALFRKRFDILEASFVFAILGSLTSVYHIYVENGGTRGLACATIDPSSTTQISCAFRYIYEFGYISMPVMALTLSVFIIVILINFKFSLKNQ